MKTKILKVFLGILIFSISYASEIGKILKYKGNVNIFRENNVLSVKNNNFPLFIKDIINTKSHSLAFIGFVDNSKVLLKEKSSLKILAFREFSVNRGRVLFKIEKRGALKGVKVRAKSVVIGVKGTKFLVNTSNNKTNVYLKKGVVNIKNLEGEFKVYRKKIEEEFEDFKKQFTEGIEEEKKEFEEYKKQVEKEFVEFVKEFTLKPNTAVSIEGNEVRFIKIPEEIEKEFELFDRLDEEI